MKDLEFNWKLFWVQLHDLPLGDMNPRSACEIGKIIGEVQFGFKEWGSQDGSSYMRIHKCGWTHRNRSIGDKKSVWRMARLVGLDLSMKDYLICVTGASF